jgi:hypothetical protein
MPLEAQTSFAFGSSSELRVQKGGGSSNCSTRRPRRPKFPRFLAALGPAPMRFPGLFLARLPYRTSIRPKTDFFSPTKRESVKFNDQQKIEHEKSDRI